MDGKEQTGETWVRKDKMLGETDEDKWNCGIYKWNVNIY